MPRDAATRPQTRLEIVGDRLVCSHAGQDVLRASVEDFVAALRADADHLPLTEAIPEGVRFIHRRGHVVVLAVEDPPQARTVRWLAEDSLAPKGPLAAYDTVCLAFPFVVLVMAFDHGDLTDFHQCFYRSAPLRTLADPLCFPNLYNCGAKEGQPSKLCLHGLPTGLAPLPWDEKIGAVRTHLWGGTFNRSVELGGHESFWPRMRHVDRRVSSVARWARETRKDPFFALTVPWEPAGLTVGEVMRTMISAVSRAYPPASAADLASVLACCPPYPTGRKPGPTPAGRQEAR